MRYRIKQYALFFLVIMQFGAVACKGNSSEAAPQQNTGPGLDRMHTGEENVKLAKSIPSTTARENAETPPRPGDVMYLIYQKDGDGAKSYAIENGSVATWWTGHEFELDGKRYFTGFATSTPEKFANEQARTTKGVTLAEATFELAPLGAPKPWAFLHSQNWMGEIGFREQAPAIDSTRPVLEHRFGPGLLLLAMPTVEGEGLVQRSYAILRYSAKAPDDVVNDRRWLYLDSIVVGEDNTAQCGAERATCAQWIGQLEFRNTQRGLPEIVLHRNGTETDDQTGLARTLTEKDNVIYIYDDKEKKYRFK